MSGVGTSFSAPSNAEVSHLNTIEDNKIIAEVVPVAGQADGLVPGDVAHVAAVGGDAGD